MIAVRAWNINIDAFKGIVQEVKQNEISLNGTKVK